jgi:spectinomycin phosphotransferase
MAKEPIIGSQETLETIHGVYGIDLENLRFAFSGWGGDCFTAESVGGEPYFLKLYDPVHYQGVAPLSMDFYLPLMHQLHTKGILTHIPHPVPSLQGDFFTEIGSQVLVITNYIQGKQVGFGRLPEPVLATLSEMVGILHKSSSQLNFEHPFIERFKTPFVPHLLKAMGALENHPPTDCKGIQRLKEVIHHQKDHLHYYLEKLRKLQNQVKSSENPMVVCHTDLHGGNLMLDDQGTLYLLDWENAMIAPREQDMIFFTKNRQVWQTFWQIYRVQFDQVSINADMLRFYHYRRGLEDVAGFVFRIMAGDGTDERDLDDLKWLESSLEELKNVEDTISKVMAC